MWIVAYKTASLKKFTRIDIYFMNSKKKFVKVRYVLKIKIIIKNITALEKENKI